MLTQAQKDSLNLQMPLGSYNYPGDLIGAKVGVLVAKYSFAKQGGAVGDISLLTDLNAPTSYAKLPANAIIKRVIIDVITAMASAGNAGTIALKAVGAGDLLAAVDADTLSGLVAGIPVGSAATSIKLTAEQTIKATIAVEALTAGKVNVIIEYYISE